ncbi:MAG: acyl-CoA dehydratase activase [Candidatus Heimdallarchaeota archaeon]
MNLVYIDDDGSVATFKRPHLGNPKQVLNFLLEEKIGKKDNFYGVSGSFGDISEIVAVDRGLNSFDEKFDVVLSLGGEAIVLYVLGDEGHIANVMSHDKCAAGSGEFFIQQIDRLGLSLPEAIQLALKGKKTEIASRCSVHCKSDITHKLNRGEALVEDLLTSVLASMVSKVQAMIIQSRVDAKRMLVIGGVSLNEAFIKILREELPKVNIVIKEVSPVFEAYGTALMVRDNPVNQEIELNITKSFTTNPPLKEFGKQVTIVEPIENKKDFKKNTVFHLGVDVGSTTTKAVLVDPSDSSVVASYYGRTSGNPINATKNCLTEIISQVGNQKVSLVGVTGSGRSIVGAYLGTPAIYNEISAHSQGAVFYDSEVDTIFEIGGQDSKYMLLQNGVPVDYAMNATCSAGTGSFLEESAKGDLGITVFDISKTAIEAKQPIRFKADCAAFINTDIRTAMQEDYGKENIVAGLVYSIVDNYLNKVKGARQVGKKIFFQGGVAKNHSIGYAFAQTTGKQIIIPPNPELVGAFGIALIAKIKFEQHEITDMPKSTSLETLIKEELKHIGSITCKSCKNYCKIERYEVGGRRFLFGGSCSKYEHQWKGSEKIAEKEDLVRKRNELMLGEENNNSVKILRTKKVIGIPRALLTHSLYPMYSTFLKELGYQVILSEIDDDKELMTNAPFCYPIQVLHGAVLDLVKKKVKMIFLPHVVNLTKVDTWRDSTFCPITQASSYIISQAFEEITILKPTLDFSLGYSKEHSLISMAMDELHHTKKRAKEAYEKAVKAQLAVEKQFLQWGQETIAKLKGTDEIGIILVGRSYNAFPPETSLNIPKKFSSMGITAIPFDFLEKTDVADIPWYFANYVKMAIDLALKNENLYILFINSFSCTIDAFIQNYVRSEMTSKPYLFLELDAHTADAGIQTRLEAFLEIVKNFNESKKTVQEKPFQVAQIKRRKGKTVVITSQGKSIDIKDPRVTLHAPPFSRYHIDVGSKMMTMFGFNMGVPTDILLDYPVKGLRCSSGKECIPLPVVLGQILTLVENRKPGEIIGMYMIRGGSPCAVYSYYHYIEQFLESNKLENVFIYRLDYLTKFLGTNLMDVLQFFPTGIVIGDLVNEIESSLRVVGDSDSLALLQNHWNEFLNGIASKKSYRSGVTKLIRNIRKIPRKDSPINYPKVLVTGDFFVRFSPFFLKELREIYNENGIIVKSSDLYELSLYSTKFNGYYEIAKKWHKDPTKFFTKLRAFLTPWDKASRNLLVSKIILKILPLIERRVRKRFKRTGLLYAEQNNLGKLLDYSDPLISNLIFGEAIPTIGKGIEILDDSAYDSLILTGPFNCLPYKVSQAILKPIYYKNNTPFLVFDVDISAITPNMKRLIHANIEQIKRKRSKNLREVKWSQRVDSKLKSRERKHERKRERLYRKVQKKEKQWDQQLERTERRLKNRTIINLIRWKRK